MSTYASDSHESQCLDHEYYYCSACKELVYDAGLNQCPVCLMFIPRKMDCICELLPKPEPDWDWLRKERLENPRW